MVLADTPSPNLSDLGTLAPPPPGQEISGLAIYPLQPGRFFRHLHQPQLQPLFPAPGSSSETFSETFLGRWGCKVGIFSRSPAGSNRGASRNPKRFRDSKCPRAPGPPRRPGGGVCEEDERGPSLPPVGRVPGRGELSRAALAA
jgi:hypothetical protein